MWQRQARDALIAKMFLEEDATEVFKREREQLQGYDLTPVVVILSSEIRKLRQSSRAL
ncbi:hypothetical protein [Campylobacter sp.]|uniref:hypothetical protein n=1 Tax=Campylobacter sp. TaxID=205 RepID=UPI0025BEC28E|nr:hypothetical protein [Campylobacter sp.]